MRDFRFAPTPANSISSSQNGTWDLIGEGVDYGTPTGVTLGGGGAMQAPNTGTCELCGLAARVRMLRGYVNGEPRVQAFCLGCAEAVDLATALDSRRRLPTFIGAPVILIVLGLTLELLAGLGGRIGIESQAGFGTPAQIGLGVGVLGLLLGTLFRIDVAALVVTVIVSFMVLASAAGIIDGAAFGWKHELVLAIGFALTIGGLALRQRVAPPPRNHEFWARDKTGQRHLRLHGKGVGSATLRPSTDGS